MADHAQGRPLYILQLGATKPKELLESATADTLIKFMIREVEHTWRHKFPECKEYRNPDGVDQQVVIVDLKGAKDKDI